MDLTGIIILLGLFFYFKTLLEHTDDTGKILVYGTIVFFLMMFTLTACQLMAMGAYHISPPKFNPSALKQHVNAQDFIPKYLPEFNPYSPEFNRQNAYPLDRPLKYL